MMEASSAAIRQMQQSLNEMVSRPVSLWNFSAAKEQLRGYINTATSPLERGEARLLLERIDELERYAMRHGQTLSSVNSPATQGGYAPSSFNPAGFGTSGFGSGSSGLGQPPVGLSANASALASAGSTPVSGSGGLGINTVGSSGPAAFDQAALLAGATAAVGSESSAGQGPGMNATRLDFDATGWLVPVVAAAPGQPNYAVKSDSGQVNAYVTALPGMRLDRYVNQSVGVHGLRGYLPQLQAAHIEVQNITRLR
jgi:hypothetical protein